MRHNYRKIPMFHAVKMPPFTEKLLMHTHTQTLLLAKVNNGPEEFTILKPIHNGDKFSMTLNLLSGSWTERRMLNLVFNIKYLLLLSF